MPVRRVERRVASLECGNIWILSCEGSVIRDSAVDHQFVSASTAHIPKARRMPCGFSLRCVMSWAGCFGWRGAQESDGGDLAQEGEDSAAALAGEGYGLG